MVVVYKKVTLNNFISLIKLKYLFKMFKYIKLYIKKLTKRVTFKRRVALNNK